MTTDRRSRFLLSLFFIAAIVGNVGCAAQVNKTMQ